MLELLFVENFGFLKWGIQLVFSYVNAIVLRLFEVKTEMQSDLMPILSIYFEVAEVLELSFVENEDESLLCTCVLSLSNRRRRNWFCRY